MLSSRPYLLRAVHDWIVDSDCTPHLLVDADFPGLEVPDAVRKGGKVVLNVSPTAVRDLIIDSELISFVARFGGFHGPCPFRSMLFKPSTLARTVAG
jgi:stringent starvation protein B